MEKIITGNLVADATRRELDNGSVVINFTVAENDPYVNKEGNLVSNPTFYECALWRDSKVLPYLKKGHLVEVMGSIGVRAYISQEGQAEQRAVGVLTLRVRKVQLHSKGKAERSAPVTTETEPQGGEIIDDLPF